MTPAPTPTPNSAGLLARLPENDRERLGEVLRRLLANGSLVGTEPGQADFYHWAYLHRDWTEEMAALLDLKLFWDHEVRLVQAVPQSAAFTLRLKLDATLVLLMLWFEFDIAVRDRGEAPPVRLSVKQLNDVLLSRFEPLRKSLPSATRLTEILRFAQRKNLLRFAPAEESAEGLIEILPTLKRVIPFQDVAEWNRHAERHLAAATSAEAAEEDPGA